MRSNVTVYRRIHICINRGFRGLRDRMRHSRIDRDFRDIRDRRRYIHIDRAFRDMRDRRYFHIDRKYLDI